MSDDMIKVQRWRTIRVRSPGPVDQFREAINKDVTVLIEIDVTKLIDSKVYQAHSNKSRKTSLCNGAITVKVS